MPYITQEARAELLEGRTAKSAGELNYLVTMLAVKYISEKGLNYENINAVVGALEGAKEEFYRRVAAPYEDVKIETNGDVYFKVTITPSTTDNNIEDFKADLSGGV